MVQPSAARVARSAGFPTQGLVETYPSANDRGWARAFCLLGRVIANLAAVCVLLALHLLEGWERAGDILNAVTHRF